MMPIPPVFQPLPCNNSQSRANYSIVNKVTPILSALQWRPLPNSLCMYYFVDQDQLKQRSPARHVEQPTPVDMGGFVSMGPPH